MLATRGLTWRIGEVAIVDRVYLDLAPGEFLGVIGPNGAGKTSLFNLITGLRRPTEGTGPAGRAGHHRAPAAPAGPARPGPYLPGVLGLRLADGAGERPARRTGAPGWLDAAVARAAADREVAAAADAALDRVGLAHRAYGAGRHRWPTARSASWRSRCCSPAAPGDAARRADGRGERRGRARTGRAVIGVVTGDSGRTVLMVEHHMDVVLRLADRIAVHAPRRAAGLRHPGDGDGQPPVQEAYLGEEL